MGAVSPGQTSFPEIPTPAARHCLRRSTEIQSGFRYIYVCLGSRQQVIVLCPALSPHCQQSRRLMAIASLSHRNPCKQGLLSDCRSTHTLNWVQHTPASGDPMTSCNPACLLSFLIVMRYTLQYNSSSSSHSCKPRVCHTHTHSRGAVKDPCLQQHQPLKGRNKSEPMLCHAMPTSGDPP